MKIGFTTLGCPDWDLDTICARAREYGYEGVDFRGLKEDVDVTLRPEFTTEFEKTKEKLSAFGLQAGINSSLKICDEALLEQNLEEAKRTVPIVAELDIPAIRVFGGGDADGHSREELAAVAARTMEAVLDIEGADQLQWVFETHDHWISSNDCKILLNRIPHPAFGFVWDVGHTSRVGAESPEETLEILGNRVKHVHLKDAVYDPDHPQAMKRDGWRYVLPGTGELPLAEAIALLREMNYDGWVIFENEKRWHPELPEPEEAFPRFVEWIRPLLEP